MNIGFISHNSKRNLMEDFCIAYKRILSKHSLYATGTTGRRITDVTGLKVFKLLPGSVGGDMQFIEMVEKNQLDLVIMFYSPQESEQGPSIEDIVRCCDEYLIPVATNIATAEALIIGLEHGDLDWRASFS